MKISDGNCATLEQEIEMVMQSVCRKARSREVLLVQAARFPRFRQLDLTPLEGEYPSMTERVNGLIESCTAEERAIVASLTDREIEEYLEAVERELSGIFPAGI